jgi:hypothetical protein
LLKGARKGAAACRASGGRAGRDNKTGRARSAWHGSIDSIKPGGREAHDAEAQAKVAVMSPWDDELGEASETVTPESA